MPARHLWNARRLTNAALSPTHATRPVPRPACGPMAGTLAGWNCRVGLRADSAHGVGYTPLSTDDDLPVVQPSCRLRPVGRRPGRTGPQASTFGCAGEDAPPHVIPVAAGCPRVPHLGGYLDP
jgi:hypothetical protein